MTWFEQYVAQYGYFAIFGLLMLGIAGPLIPDETILVLAGIMIRRGTLAPAPTALSALAGSLCGITLSYTMGRTGVLFLLQRFGGKHVARVHSWFEKYGRWTLFFGFYVAGVRHFTALVAGASKLELRPFAAYAYSGALVWVSTFLAIGYFVGDQWEHLEGSVNRIAIAAAVVLAAAVLAFVWYRRRSRRIH